MATFLSTVNLLQVLLREAQTASVSTNTYSKLLGELVNRAKRQVEDGYDWSCLKSDAVTATTVAGTATYSLSGTTQRSRFYTKHRYIYNTTTQNRIYPMRADVYDDIVKTSTVQNNEPSHYFVRGAGSSGELKVVLYPTPAAVYTISVPLCVPQADFLTDGTNDATAITVPSEPILQLAYDYALKERGDDGGADYRYAVSEYNRAMGLAILADSGVYEDMIFQVV